MCGINGIYQFDSSPVTKTSIEEMNKSLFHRGPDGEGTYFSQFFAMGMRRLSIIDLAQGQQPISNEDNTIHVILNGEIYNYIELRRDLINKGHQFKTHSDVEVLVHLYEEYGLNALNYLNGMFAFALWDENKKRLLLARDPLGIKPLVYYLDEKKLIFSSHIDAIFSSKLVNKKINLESLLFYFALSYVPAPYSIYHNIQKLLPGTYLLIEHNTIKIEKYWELPKPTIAVPTEEFIHETKQLLIQAVKLQSRSDVPIGTMLSGGLDSSALTAFFCQEQKNPVHTFSVDFANKATEAPYAQALAKQYQTLHTHYVLNPLSAFNLLMELMPLLDEPIADSAIVPTYWISKAAQMQKLKVILSGAGADELFAGYRRHYYQDYDFLKGNLNKIPFSIWLYLGNFIHTSITHLGIKFSYSAVDFALSTSGVNLGNLQWLIGNQQTKKIFYLLHQLFSPLDALEQEFGKTHARLRLDLGQYLPNNILNLQDKATMAASIEGRVPFLDKQLVSYIFSVKPYFHSNHFNTAKSALKTIMRNDLPASILNRSKVGFNGPVEHWVRAMINTKKEEILNLLEHSCLNQIIDRKRLKMCFENKVLFSRYAQLVFSSVYFLYWERCHVNSN